MAGLRRAATSERNKQKNSIFWARLRYLIFCHLDNCVTTLSEFNNISTMSYCVRIIRTQVGSKNVLIRRKIPEIRFCSRRIFLYQGPTHESSEIACENHMTLSSSLISISLVACARCRVIRSSLPANWHQIDLNIWGQGCWSFIMLNFYWKLFLKSYLIISFFWFLISSVLLKQSRGSINRFEKIKCQWHLSVDSLIFFFIWTRLFNVMWNL